MALYDFQKEEDVKEYLQNLFTEYKFLCYHEKRADGCHLLGDFFEAVKHDFKAAATLYKSNCDDQKYAHSCLKFANLTFVGKGCEENRETALNYYKKGCELNDYRSCLQGGALLIRPDSSYGKLETDYVEGLKLLEKGCNGRNGLSCYYASALYLTGVTDIPKDLSKAFTLTKKACALGIAPACANLSMMYRKGDGTDKNEKLADLYKQKVEDMNSPKKVDLQQHS